MSHILTDASCFFEANTYTSHSLGISGYWDKTFFWIIPLYGDRTGGDWRYTAGKIDDNDG